MDNSNFETIDFNRLDTVSGGVGRPRLPSRKTRQKIWNGAKRLGRKAVDFAKDTMVWKGIESTFNGGEKKQEPQQ